MQCLALTAPNCCHDIDTLQASTLWLSSFSGSQTAGVCARGHRNSILELSDVPRFALLYPWPVFCSYRNSPCGTNTTHTYLYIHACTTALASQCNAPRRHICFNNSSARRPRCQDLRVRWQRFRNVRARGGGPRNVRSRGRNGNRRRQSGDESYRRHVPI